MDEYILQLTEVDLQKILSYRGLSTDYTTKEELVTRVQSCLTTEDTPESLLEIILFEENDHFEDSFSEPVMTTNFLFKDVEDALEKFSGESERNVDAWITSYEAVATTCNWNDIQKYLYARKLLIGAAKKCIEADDTIVTYALLIAKLKRNSRKKLRSVTFTENWSRGGS